MELGNADLHLLFKQGDLENMSDTFYHKKVLSRLAKLERDCISLVRSRNEFSKRIAAIYTKYAQQKHTQLNYINKLRAKHIRNNADMHRVKALLKFPASFWTKMEKNAKRMDDFKFWSVKRRNGRKEGKKLYILKLDHYEMQILQSFINRDKRRRENKFNENYRGKK